MRKVLIIRWPWRRYSMQETTDRHFDCRNFSRTAGCNVIGSYVVSLVVSTTFSSAKHDVTLT